MSICRSLIISWAQQRVDTLSLGVDELCFACFHEVMTFTDTNIFLAHCNPLGLRSVLFATKSFLWSRAARGGGVVIRTCLGVNLTCDSQSELGLERFLEKGEEIFPLGKRKAEWDKFLYLDLIQHIFTEWPPCVSWSQVPTFKWSPPPWPHPKSCAFVGSCVAFRYSPRRSLEINPFAFEASL